MTVQLLIISILLIELYRAMPCLGLKRCLGIGSNQENEFNGVPFASNQISTGINAFKKSLRKKTRKAHQQKGSYRIQNVTNTTNEYSNKTSKQKFSGFDSGWEFDINLDGEITKFRTSFQIFDYFTSESFYMSSDYWANQIKTFDHNLKKSKHRLIQTKDKTLKLTVYTMHNISIDKYLVVEYENKNFKNINFSDIDVVLNGKSYSFESKWMEQFIWFYKHYQTFSSNQTQKQRQWSIIQDSFLYYLDPTEFNIEMKYDLVNECNRKKLLRNLKSLNKFVKISKQNYKFQIQFNPISLFTIVPTNYFLERVFGGIILDILRTTKYESISIFISFHSTEKLIIKFQLAADQPIFTNILSKNHGILLKTALTLLKSNVEQLSNPFRMYNMFNIQTKFNTQIMPPAPLQSKSPRLNISRFKSDSTKLGDSIKSNYSITKSSKSHYSHTIASASSSTLTTIRQWLELSPLSTITETIHDHSNFDNLSVLHFTEEYQSTHNKSINVLVIQHSAQRSRDMLNELNKLGTNVHVALARNIADAEHRFLRRRKLRWHLFIIEDIDNGKSIGKGAEWIRKNYNQWNIKKPSKSIYVTSLFKHPNHESNDKKEIFHWLIPPIDLERFTEIWLDHGWVMKKEDKPALYYNYNPINVHR